MRTRHGQHVRSRRRWLIALALVGIVLLHAVLIVRVFLSPEQFRLRTQAILRQHWPGNVVLGKAAYEFPAGFRLAEIRLDRSKARGGARLFQAKALRVQCSLLAALRGKLVVEELVLEEPELFLKADDLREMRGKKGAAPKAAFGRIILRGGRIHLGEGVLFEGSPAQELRALSVELTQSRRLPNGFVFEGEAESSLSGRCTLNGTVDLEGKRFDADLVARRIEIGPRLRELLPPKAVQALDRYDFQGAVNLTTKLSVAWGGESPVVDLTASAELLGCAATWARFPLPITALRGEVVFDGASVHYRNIRGRAGSASIQFSGTTVPMKKVEIRFEALDRSLDEELRQAIEAMPPPPPRPGAPPMKRHPLARLWERYNVAGGTIDVTAHSTYDIPARKWQVDATIRLRDAEATYEKFPYPLTGLTGTFEWRGEGVERRRGARGQRAAPAGSPPRHRGMTKIVDLRGRRGDAIVEITGESTDQGVIDVIIKASNVPLDKTLYAALHERWKKTFDQFRPTGTIAVECRISGPTKKPLKPQYRLTIRPEGVSFRHVKFPHRIDNVRGEIRIDEKGRVTLHDLTGRLGEIPLKFLGSVTPGPEGPVTDLTVAAPEVELGPPVRALLTKGLAAVHDQLDPRGVVAFAWKLTEDPAAGLSRQSYEIRCLDRCSIQPRRFPLRIEGLLGRAHVDGTGRAIFTGMKGRIGKAVVEAIHGEYVPGAKGGLRFTLKGSGMAFDDALRRALPESWRKVWDELEPRGEADVEYQFAANPADPEHPFQRVSIEPRNAAITCRKFPLPCTEIARGKVTFDQDGSATISNIQGKVRGSTVVLTGKVASGPKTSPIHLEITARKLPLDAELRKALPKEWQARWDSFQPSGAADLELTVDGDLKAGTLKLTSLRASLEGCRATYAKLPIPLTDLRGRVEFEGGVATLTDVVGRSAVADQVRLEGRVAAEGARGTRLRVRAQNLRLVPELVAALPEDVRKAFKESALKGTVDVDVTLTSPPKGAGKGMAFFGSIGLRRGSFRRGHVVEELDGDFRIERGVVDEAGGLELAGTLNLRKLVAHKLVATGVQGQFAYAVQRGDGEDAPAVPLLRLTGLQGSFYGGRLSVPKCEIDLATGTVRTASVLLTDVDFKEFCKNGLGYKGKVSGVLDLKIETPPGTLKDKGLSADGVARVDHGELGKFPVAAAVFDVLAFQLPERSITKGEMHFGVARDKLIVKRISLGREGWLMTGWGTVGFDQTLSLKFVTPRTGSILALPRIIVGTLVETDVGGTIDKPTVGQTIGPAARVYDEFKKIFKVW